MTTWTFKRLSTGETIDVTAGSRWDDGISAFKRHIAPVFEAARTDGKRVSTAKIEINKEGGFELIAVDGKARSTVFKLLITWYQPTIVSEAARVDSAMDGGARHMGMLGRH